MKGYDYLIVGAGLFGSVFAHEMSRRGRRCLVIEKRDHIGGNCYTEDRDGIAVHVHGPHIFHTDSEELWSYVNRFARFEEYRYVVKAFYRGRLYSFPINLGTLRQVFGEDSDARAIARMHEDRAPYQDRPRDNIEDWCLAEVGPTLYEMFIRGYTTKQWRKSPRELDAAIIKRLPVREVENDNYYRHRYQGIPPHGYTEMFRTMLSGAEVRLGVDYFEARDYWNVFARKVVFTGEIDRFFDYRHGQLEWRSLRFVQDIYEVKDKQGHAVINFTDDKVPHTRPVEYRHFAPQHTGHIPVTHVVREYPANVSDTGEVYYPVPTSGNRKTFQQYHAMSLELKRRVIFGGRLANYVYIDMAPTIRMALNAARREAETRTEAVAVNQA